MEPAPVLPRRPRGARPTPRHTLASASPYQVRGQTPDRFLVLPRILSMWGNDRWGDCVTAEEAFNQACAGVLISDAVVRDWAQRRGYLDGADLESVLISMRESGFGQGGNVYGIGPALAVDWTDAALLRNAISQGRVKIGVAADQLERAVGRHNGWFAVGFRSDPAEDHCVSLSGFGPIAWLADSLAVTVPAGVNPASDAYALFTWDTVGIIDAPSLLAITHEAWLRTPNATRLGSSPVPVDPVAIYPPLAPPPVALRKALTDHVLGKRPPAVAPAVWEQFIADLLEFLAQEAPSLFGK